MVTQKSFVASPRKFNFFPMITNPISGIDISHNNGNIDWSKVKAYTPALSFAYMKATQGVGFQDPKVATNAPAAQKSGLSIGYYHFASLNQPSSVVQDATAEANWFDKVMKTLPAAHLLPVLDIETNDRQLTTQQVQQWINTFLAVMKTLGHPTVIIYSYKPFLDANLPANHTFGVNPLWLAQYRNVAAPALPRGWTDYTIWQYSAQGNISGIAGDVDMNKADASFLTLS